jgi:uncharacterized protein involved in response to NO
MTLTIEEPARAAREPALFANAFRPLFLASAGWAIVGIALWLAMLFGYIELPSRFDPLTWHIHEMLFGFVMAAVGGFLMTAIPNWTGRLPVKGRRLALLAALWLLGRIACMVSAALPAWLAIATDLSFPVALLAVAAREIVAGANWRNLPMTAPLTVFIAADLLMHLQSLGVDLPDGLGWRLGLAAPILLIVVIGGRIIPSFTRNWLVKRGSTRLPAPHGPVDKAAIGVLLAGFILWAVLPDSPIAGAILLVAAVLHAWRLARWAGERTLAEPLLFILHVGYGWVALGTGLLGLSILVGGVPVDSAIHALTAGAIAIMILAMMPRVSLGHTGRELTASRATRALYLLIGAAAIMRVVAPWIPAAMMQLVALSGICWVAAFALFVMVYAPMLMAPRPARGPG